MPFSVILIMKFGRLEEDALSRVAWTLPPDSPATQALLVRLPCRVNAPSIYIGGSVWSDRNFVGKVYPRGTPVKDYLKAYCRRFNTVELNATFYGIPSSDRIKKWKQSTTPGFRFCPKVPRSISHGSNMDVRRRLLDNFIEVVLHFEEALGMTFMQLSPYFQPSHLPALQKLLTQVPQGFSIAVELRHAAWFSDLAAQQALFAFFRERGITAVITDVAGRRDVLHQTLTTSCAFIRFTGNNLHATDYTRIDAWVKRLHQWIKKGLAAIYFLLHEPEKALAADLAAYMIYRLNNTIGLPMLGTHLTEP